MLNPPVVQSANKSIRGPDNHKADALLSSSQGLLASLVPLQHSSHEHLTGEISFSIMDCWNFRCIIRYILFQGNITFFMVQKKRIFHCLTLFYFPDDEVCRMPHVLPFWFFVVYFTVYLGIQDRVVEQQITIKPLQDYKS